MLYGFIKMRGAKNVKFDFYIRVIVHSDKSL